MTDAIHYRPVTAHYPDDAGKQAQFDLVSTGTINSAGELISRDPRYLLLDENGQGTIHLPTPDGTGDESWLWRVLWPDGQHSLFTLPWGASSIALSTLIAAAATSLTPDAIALLVAGKMDLVSPAGTAGHLVQLAAGGQQVESAGIAATAVGNATLIQNRNIASNAPSDGQALIWNNAQSRWQPETLTAPFWLGSIPNTLIVDPSGAAPGSYLTLGAALAIAGAGDTIRVFGTTTETTDIFIDDTALPAVDLTIHLEPGSVVNLGSSFGYYLLHTSAIHRIYGPGEIRSSGEVALSLFLGTFEIVGTTIRNTAASKKALDLQPLSGGTIKSYNSRYIASGANGISIQKNAGALAAGSIFSHDVLHGRLLCSVTWSSAPFYHCSFNGTVTNVTANAGTANGSNTVF